MRKLSLFLVLPLIYSVGCNNQQHESNHENADTAQATETVGVVEESPVTVEEVWATDTTLETPESVLYDPEDAILFVSNIGGKNPEEKDDNGFISKVSLDGKIENLKWVTGLNAPKGMGLLGENLYVTDIDRLVEINTETGEITETWPVEGAKFLNDIAADTVNNTLYVTDMSENKIYKFKDGALKVWIDSSLSGPNGVYVHDGKLYLASNGDQTFKSIDLNTKSIMTIATGIGAGDGVEYTGMDDEFLVSDWNGQVYLLDTEPNADEEKEDIMDNSTVINTKDQKVNSADIGFIKGQNILLVPTFFDNRVVAYKIDMAL